MPYRAILPRIERIQRRVEARMFPQFVEIYIPEPQINDYGMRTKPNTTRMVYKGSSLIPCRLDVSKHYRQAAIYAQEVNVSEFTLDMPRSLRPPLDAIVVCEGVAYEIRKLEDQQAWDTATRALLVRVNTVAPYSTPEDFLTDGGDGYLVAEDGIHLLLGG